MLTPLDIHNKVFARAFRGYKMEEVDAFLDEIIRDYESYFRENKELRDKIALLEDEVKKGREISAVLEKTMVLAQKVHDEEATRAKKESDVIIREAESKGEKLIQDAENEVLDIRQQIEHLRLFEKQLYLKHKGFLEFQMELLDGYKDKETILTDSDMEKLSQGRHERELIEDEIADGETLPDVVFLEETGTAGEGEENIAIRQDEPISTDGDDAEINLNGVAGTTDSQAAAPGSSTAEAEAYVNEDSEAGEKGEAVATDIDAFEQEETLTALAAGERQEESTAVETEEDKQRDYGAVVDSCVEADLDIQASEEADLATRMAADTVYPVVREQEGTGDEVAVDTPDGEESPFVVNEEVDSMEKVVLLAQKMEEALKALDAMYTTEETED